MVMTRSREIVIEFIKACNVREIYDQIKAEGLAEIIAYDVEYFTFVYFNTLVKDCGGWFYVCRSQEGVLLAFFFLNHFESERVARIHFCTFRAGRPYLISGGLQVLDWLVPAGFDSLIGWLPEWNILSIKYLKRLGFYIVGRIPGACGCVNHPAAAAIITLYTNRSNKDANKKNT